MGLQGASLDEPQRHGAHPFDGECMVQSDLDGTFGDGRRIPSDQLLPEMGDVEAREGRRFEPASFQDSANLRLPHAGAQVDRDRCIEQVERRDALREGPVESGHDENHPVRQRDRVEQRGEFFGELRRLDGGEYLPFPDEVVEGNVAGRASLAQFLPELGRAQDRNDRGQWRFTYPLFAGPFGVELVSWISPPFTPTVIVDPSRNSPARRRVVRGSTTIRWIVRRSGRAPNWGS